MITFITHDDCQLVNDLSRRTYSGNKLLSAATTEERDRLIDLRRRLKHIATNFATRYDPDYGKLDVSVSTGNPIAIGGQSLNRVWSGIFKGAENKQYSAQVSFVLDPEKPCLNVGFYFGRASAHSLSIGERGKYEDRLHFLGSSLSSRLASDPDSLNAFETLLDNGFTAMVGEKQVSGSAWISQVSKNPTNCHIIYPLQPGEYGLIDPSSLHHYVALVIRLIGIIPDSGTNATTQQVKPLSPEERAKQAELRAMIGHKGELFVLEVERRKLADWGIDVDTYLSHVAEISTTYGYDILSCDRNRRPLHLEVKTTTRLPGEPGADTFYLSKNEYDVYLGEKSTYKIIRVYNIEGDSPSYIEVDLDRARMETKNYTVTVENT